ncbi:MAG: hypothetical protein ACRDKE_10720 [Solirubrobacterales bacterium]
MNARRLSRNLAVCAVVVSAASAVLAPSAFAGTRAGATCVATRLGPNLILNTSHVVAADGVITSWGSTVAPSVVIANPMLLKLKVVSPVSGSTWKVVAESAAVQLASNENTFAVQIPVKAGSVFGSWAAASPTSGSPYCESSPQQDFYWGSDGALDTPVGNTLEMNSAPGNENAIWTVVEPDLDGDGFGDDTQDACPTSPASQNAAACPAPPISTYLNRTAKSLTVYASSKFTVPLQATGTVKLSKKKSIVITSSLTAVSAFGITPIKLNYTKALRKAIAAAPKKKPLKMSLLLRGGTPLATVKTVSVKLTPVAK